MDALFSLRSSPKTLGRVFWFSAVLLLAAGCHSQSTVSRAAPAAPTVRPIADVQASEATAQVVKTYPHDPQAFTQGLLWHDGVLYESTGLEGKSSLRRVDLATGKVLQIRRLPAEIFGEGLCLVGGKLIQISWQNGRAFVYDLQTLAPVGQWAYQGEGWGLAYNGKDIIMSDGSATLTWRDPQTFEEKKRVLVTLNGKPLDNLNELEWIGGEVWANVWQTDFIVRINPETGTVTQSIDCSSLKQGGARGQDVLNGIAYDPENKKIFITGKLWPKLFEIKVREP